jgi:hypothetical protein
MSNIINDRYLDTSNDMLHCIVYKKTGLSTTFELYDEAKHQFIMACVMCPHVSPMILFLKQQNCHLRRFDEICCNLSIKHFIARMTPDWITGHVFNVTGSNGQFICEIK